MKRFILTGAPDAGGEVRLAGEDFHYLVNVRRLAPGECFPALLPSGGGVIVRVVSTAGGVLAGKCLPDESSGETEPPENFPRLVLFQALPKGEKMDLIVRQAAEGGLAEIVPFEGEFSEAKLRGKARGNKRGLPEDAVSAKLARWQRIVKEARQQSGSRTATLVLPPVTADELFARWDALKAEYPECLGLLFHQAAAPADPLAQTSLHGYLDKSPNPVALAIGPEGGFSPAEVSRFLQAGFKPFTIGNTVLRTETAALYAAAAVRIILLEKNSWELKNHR